MEQDNSRNTMIFVVCAVAVMLAYQMFVLGPAQRRQDAEARAKAAAAAANPIATAAPGAAVYVDRPQALAQSPRVKIETVGSPGTELEFAL